MRPSGIPHSISPKTFIITYPSFFQITHIHLQHRTIMNHITTTFLTATFAVASIIPALSTGLIIGETLSCTQYAQANTQSATCGDRPNATCSQKCVGGVVVDGCSSAPNASVPLTRQTCTISFSHVSPTSSICVNGQGSFMCSGAPTGQATCSGCVDSKLHLDLPAPVLGAPAPAIATSPSSAASIVAPTLAVNATAPQLPSAAPATNVTTVTAVPAVSTQVVTVYSQPTRSNRTSSKDEYSLQSDDSSSDSSNTTSIASISYNNPAAQFVVTLGLLAAGVTLL